MQKKATLIHEITHNQLLALFEGLQNQLTELKQNFEPKTPVEYLTRKEVAELLKCDLTTIWNRTKQGKLISYGIGNRVYYKRNEVEKSLIRLS